MSAHLGACVLAAAWLALVSFPLRAADAPLHYELAVALDPPRRALRIRGHITIPAGRSVRLRLDERFRIERWESRAAGTESAAQQASPTLPAKLTAPTSGALTIALEYGGQLDALDTALDHRRVLDIDAPLAAADGAFLPAGSRWYPEPDRGRVTYRIRVELPPGYRAVVPGTLEQERHEGKAFAALFASDTPLPGIDLLVGRYLVAERMTNLPSGRTVRLRTYFHSELAALAPVYLEAAAAHLERYDAAIGPYAFPSYSVVSSSLPVGFGMPGIAYLGKQVLRLPFIPATSLRHEVLHDWWGNGVVPDYGEGNWAEGLTTLMADHAHRAEQGEAEAARLRLGWLRDYAAVPAAADKPLAQFVARRHGADQALGYNKTAFVFFMLRELIGAEAFEAALRAFWRDQRLHTAGWPALQRAFERQAQRNLDFFFDQWIGRAGAPRLTIARARNDAQGSSIRLHLDLRQEEPGYRLRVPLRIWHAKGHSDVVADIDSAHSLLTLPIPAPAQSVEIDPEVRLFRHLHAEEIAPTLRQVYFHPGSRVAVAADAPDGRAAAMHLASTVLEHPVRLLEAEAGRPHTPLLIVGLHQSVERLLARWAIVPPGVPGAEPGQALAYAVRAPWGEPLAVVAAPDAKSLAALARSLPHLGGQSYALFQGARSVARGLWPFEPRRYPVSQ